MTKQNRHHHQPQQPGTLAANPPSTRSPSSPDLRLLTTASASSRYSPSGAPPGPRRPTDGDDEQLGSMPITLRWALSLASPLSEPSGRRPAETNLVAEALQVPQLPRSPPMTFSSKSRPPTLIEALDAALGIMDDEWSPSTESHHTGPGRNVRTAVFPSSPDTCSSKSPEGFPKQ